MKQTHAELGFIFFSHQTDAAIPARKGYTVAVRRKAYGLKKIDP